MNSSINDADITAIAFRDLETEHTSSSKDETNMPLSQRIASQMTDTTEKVAAQQVELLLNANEQKEEACAPKFLSPKSVEVDPANFAVSDTEIAAEKTSCLDDTVSNPKAAEEDRTEQVVTPKAVLFNEDAEKESPHFSPPQSQEATQNVHIIHEAERESNEESQTTTVQKAVSPKPEAKVKTSSLTTQSSWDYYFSLTTVSSLESANISASQQQIVLSIAKEESAIKPEEDSKDSKSGHNMLKSQLSTDPQADSSPNMQGEFEDGELSILSCSEKPSPTKLPSEETKEVVSSLGDLEAFNELYNFETELEVNKKVKSPENDVDMYAYFLPNENSTQKPAVIAEALPITSKNKEVIDLDSVFTHEFDTVVKKAIHERKLLHGDTLKSLAKPVEKKRHVSPPHQDQSKRRRLTPDAKAKSSTSSTRRDVYSPPRKVSSSYETSRHGGKSSRNDHPSEDRDKERDKRRVKDEHDRHQRYSPSSRRSRDRSHHDTNNTNDKKKEERHHYSQGSERQRDRDRDRDRPKSGQFCNSSSANSRSKGHSAGKLFLGFYNL